MPGAILQMTKRDRLCTIAKIVELPEGEVILAIPYRNRQAVTNCVSLPPAALRQAWQTGARRLIVRFDKERLCLAIELAEIKNRGWLQSSDGEWYVKLSDLRPIPWINWPYVPKSQVINLDGVA